MASLHPPALGRPLSFPHPHPQDETDISQDDGTPRPNSTSQFTSMPLRDESGSVRENSTEDDHSLANTFGTTELLRQNRESQIVDPNGQGTITPSFPSQGGISHSQSEGSQPTSQEVIPARDTAQTQITPSGDHNEHTHQASIAATSNPKNSDREDSSSSETMHNRPSSSSAPTDQSDLHDPSSKRLVQAGILVGSVSGAGTAARHLLAKREDEVGQEGGRQPRGYEKVDVPDKWGVGSKNVKEARRKAIKKAAMLFGIITLWLWVCLSIFWGSTYRLTSFLPSLTVHVIPFDTPSSTSYLNGPMTQQMTYVANEPPSIVHLGYEIKDPANYPNGLEDVRRSVLAQECWAAIVVNANASTAWTEALQNGDATYDPTGSIGIYYMGARFYQVVLLYFDSLISRDLANPLATARSQALEAFMASSSTNPALLTNAARVPQAIGVGFGYTIFDIRPTPNSGWAGAAPMEASLIYFLIFAFYLCLFGGMARMKSGLNSRLKMSSMFAIRFGWPLLAYFFLSLWQTLIVRAWQVPLTDHLGRAGFVTLWALNYVTILASGFALETMLALLGISWLPFFLIFWIIPSSFYPIELMPNFYRFLRWMPFVHNVEAYKIIAYGTNLQHRLGLHFGILFAVIGVELICFPLALLFERWKSDRDQRKQIDEKKKMEESEKKDNGENSNGEA
ncbi:hypothetical protein I302_102746 [Kwoniella bestiolae CBS 10118]|uniref:DUF3533 domain-containing protein n=1 Tax=Kwoniella bestiolae CBS 10118 TaxID=1296100 RepID=A0A1B9GFY2_9TREE|nr:hypothetical protein I302_01439 [Kwoniella bestiolae CBS 10118]OCF29926.1 hypothetical protein I302_01439 [Kwoniella bestiolae CBS 10118]